MSIEDYSPAQQPIAWQQFNDKRRAKRAKTYQAIHALAKKRCNTISECDNPYVWPLIVTAIESTLRLGSLLELEWDQLDLDNRIGMVGSKTDPVRVLISKPLQQMLHHLPRDPSGRVFPMTANAVDMAWDGIREKAGLKKLQFRDLRHLGATMYARRGHSAAELKEILGHKSTRMAEVYVNIVGTHLLERMDELHDRSPTLTVAPPVIDGSAKETMKAKRSHRIVDALKKKVDELTENSDAKVEVTSSESAGKLCSNTSDASEFVTKGAEEPCGLVEPKEKSYEAPEDNTEHVAEHDTERPSGVAASNVIAFAAFRSKLARERSRLAGSTSYLTPGESCLSTKASSSQ